MKYASADPAITPVQTSISTSAGSAVGLLDRQWAGASPRDGERRGQQPRPFVVEAADLREVDARLRGALLDRALETVDLRRRCRGQLAGEGDVAAGGAGLRHERAPAAFLPRRRRALELHDVLERELVEAVAVARPLHQVEQREPRQRREPGVVVGRDALLEQRARRRALPARVEQRGVLEHGAQARIRLHHLERGLRRRVRHLDQARAGHRDVASRRFDDGSPGFLLAAEHQRGEVARRRPLGRGRDGPRLGRRGHRLLGRGLGEEGHGES
ncbi:MAG: hypothetical protein IPF73_08575 [Betaproteobacteria bacterium]|nr:hypothetical protein [Betaproteobacteria bacterium]